MLISKLAQRYENLTPGTRYFALTAISAVGVESSLSNVLTTVTP